MLELIYKGRSLDLATAAGTGGIVCAYSFIRAIAKTWKCFPEIYFIFYSCLLILEDECLVNGTLD